MRPQHTHTHTPLTLAAAARLRGLLQDAPDYPSDPDFPDQYPDFPTAPDYPSALPDAPSPMPYFPYFPLEPPYMPDVIFIEPPYPPSPEAPLTAPPIAPPSPAFDSTTPDSGSLDPTALKQYVDAAVQFCTCEYSLCLSHSRAMSAGPCELGMHVFQQGPPPCAKQACLRSTRNMLAPATSHERGATPGPAQAGQIEHRMGRVY